MTDNEIIKALNACRTTQCKDCSLCNNPCEIDYGGVPSFIVDLINRQKAEIERLQKHNTEMARKHYQDGKAEAVKELVERAEEKAFYPDGSDWNAVWVDDLKELAKELAGGKGD